MRLRPVRSKIYLPVVRFFVVSSDWKFVLLATLVGYLVPFFLRLKVWVVPVWLFTGLGTLLVSVAFFNFIRIGRRPHWFQHTMRALVRHPRERRALPVDAVKQPPRPWIRDAVETSVNSYFDGQGRSPVERVIAEQ